MGRHPALATPGIGVESWASSGPLLGLRPHPALTHIHFKKVTCFLSPSSGFLVEGHNERLQLYRDSSCLEIGTLYNPEERNSGWP